MILVFTFSLFVLGGLILNELEKRDSSRRSQNRDRCPECGQDVTGDWLLCPHCSQRLRTCCSFCQRLRERALAFCPCCGSPAEEDA